MALLLTALKPLEWFNDWADQIGRVRAKIDITPRALADDEVAALVDFMDALTGAGTTRPLFGVPDSVPSGLPVDK